MDEHDSGALDAARARRLVSLRHLRCFLAVAESGSFTAAASRLFITQSALTATIQQFEESVGLKLFDRTTRRVLLTDAGTRFEQQATRIVNDFDCALHDLKAIADGQRGHIRVAAIPSVIYEYLTVAMPLFRKQFPNVTIGLHDAGAWRIEQMVLNGEVDFGITARHKEYDDLQYTPLIRDRYGVVCRAGHPLLDQRGPLRWKSLPAKGYVSFSRDTAIGSCLSEQVGNRALFETPHDEVSGTTSLFALLGSGEGYSIVPALSVKATQRSDIAFRELTAPVLNREIFLITRRLRSISPVAKHLLDALLGSIRSKPLPPGVALIHSQASRESVARGR